MIIEYLGQQMDLRRKVRIPTRSFNEDALWITNPEQKKIDNVICVGEFSNEYCIPLSRLGEYRILLDSGSNVYGLLLKEKRGYRVSLPEYVSFFVYGQNIGEAIQNMDSAVLRSKHYSDLMAKYTVSVTNTAK